MSGVEGHVRFLSSYFYVDGMDREDVEQEARIAAWLAPAGAERIAARRRIVDLLIASRRLKRGSLVELEDDLVSRIDVLEAVVVRETLRNVLAAPMSEAEREALGRVLRGEPIRRDEHRLGVAIWRLRRRLKRDFVTIPDKRE